MLCNAHDRTISLPLHHALQRTHPLAHLQSLHLDNDHLALGNGPEVRHVQVARDAEILPKSWFANQDQGEGGAAVEKGGLGTAVEVAETVGVLLLAGEGESDRWSWGIGVDGIYGQVGYEFLCEFLEYGARH